MFSVIPAESDSPCWKSESEPIVIDITKKKLKTKAERNKLAPQFQAVLSSSENMGPDEPSGSQTRRKARSRKNRQTLDRQDESVEKRKIKTKKTKSPSPDNEYKPSDEALVFWGKTAASSELPVITKAKSLVQERDIRKSSVSIKNKQSAPATLVDAKVGDGKVRPADIRTRSKSKTKPDSPAKNHQSQERTPQAKSKDGDRNKHRTSSGKRTSRDGKQQIGERKSKEKQKHTNQAQLEDKYKTPKKKSSRKNNAKKIEVEDDQFGQKVKKKCSKEHTFENISPIPTDFVASPLYQAPAVIAGDIAEQVTAVDMKAIENVSPEKQTNQTVVQLPTERGVTTDSHCHKVCELRGIYEDGRHIKCSKQNESEKGNVNFDAESEITAPVFENLIDPVIKLQTRTSAAQCAAPQVSDYGVQCDKSERSSAMEQKLSAIEQTVKDIQTTMSELACLIGSSGLQGKDTGGKTTQQSEPLSHSKSDGGNLPMASSIKALNDILDSFPHHFKSVSGEEKYTPHETGTPVEACNEEDITENGVDGTIECHKTHSSNIIDHAITVEETLDNYIQEGYIQDSPVFVTASGQRGDLSGYSYDLPSDTAGRDDTPNSSAREHIDNQASRPSDDPPSEDGYSAPSSYIINLNTLLAGVPGQFTDGMVLEVELESDTDSEDEEESTGVVITELSEAQIAQIEQEQAQQLPKYTFNESFDRPCDVSENDDQELSVKEDSQNVNTEKPGDLLSESRSPNKQTCNPWHHHNTGYSRLPDGSDEEQLLPIGDDVASIEKNDPAYNHSASSHTEDTRTVVQQLKEKWDAVNDTSLHTEVGSVNNTDRLKQLDSVNEQTAQQSASPIMLTDENQPSTAGITPLMDDDVSVTTEVSMQSFFNTPEHIQLPLPPEKKRPSLKSRLAKAFGLKKKDKPIDQLQERPETHGNDSISENIDDLFERLPPPAASQQKPKKKATWGRGSNSKTSRHESVKSSITESSASSMPKEPPPPPPQQQSWLSLKKKTQFNKKSSKASTKTITEDYQMDNVSEQLESLLE